jgi:hypothetical protein
MKQPGTSTCAAFSNISCEDAQTKADKCAKDYAMGMTTAAIKLMQEKCTIIPPVD